MPPSRSARIELRASEADRELIVHAAEACQMKISEFAMPHLVTEARRVLASSGPGPKPAQKQIGEIAFEARLVDGVPGRELKSLADDLKRRINSGVVAVVSRADGKAAIVVGVTPDLTSRFDAVELVRLGAEALGGKGGGGRADMAQAGGPAAASAEAALAAIEGAVAAKVKAATK